MMIIPSNGESGGSDRTSDTTDEAVARSPKGRSRSAKARSRASTPSKLNFIQPAPAPVKAHRETPRTANANGVRRALDTESVPEAIRERYAQDGRQYFFPSGERAFEDHGTRLSTPSENTTVVRDLIAVAAARGWNEIKVGGTKTFRQEAWRAAKLAGLEVAGYTPTRAEQALLIRALSRRETPSAGESHDRDKEETREDKVSDRRPREARVDRDMQAGKAALITGRLLEHRADHYLHDPEEDMSYFVRIKTGRDTEREVWGVDLERAIRQSLTDVQIGDDIGLRAVERREFRLKTQRRDETGQKVPTEVQAHRNGWIVEQRRFFNDRVALAKTFRDAELRPSEGYRRHPELKGSYLELQAAKLRFEESVKNPQDRARFLTQLRERMAAAIERGEPLMPVRLRERAQTQKSDSPTQNMPDPERVLSR